MADDTTNPTTEPVVVEVPKEYRLTETVHIADPRSGSVTVIQKGQPAPDWAADLIPEQLLEDASAPGVLPASMTGGLVPPADAGQQQD